MCKIGGRGWRIGNGCESFVAFHPIVESRAHGRKFQLPNVFLIYFSQGWTPFSDHRSGNLGVQMASDTAAKHSMRHTMRCWCVNSTLSFLRCRLVMMVRRASSTCDEPPRYFELWAHSILCMTAAYALQRMLQKASQLGLRRLWTYFGCVSLAMRHAAC